MNKQFDIVIKGKLVLENEVVNGEIGINDGKIEEIHIGKDSLIGNKYLDFKNQFVFPGMIDVHVHCFSNPEGIRNLAIEIAERRGLLLNMDTKLKVNPVLIHDQMKDIVKDAVEKSGFSSVFLPSGAAHDAMIMGKYVPTAMIFVRSQDGISHNPKEWTSLDDIVAGCKVLKETLYQLVEM